MPDLHQLHPSVPGKLIVDPEELMLRQIHPKWMDGGRVTHVAFRPFPKDDGYLSVSRRSMITPEDALALHRAGGHETMGVMGLTVGELGHNSIHVYEDPVPETEDTLANPAHASADYRHLTKNQREKVAKRLGRAANERGWLHRDQ